MSSHYNPLEGASISMADIEVETTLGTGTFGRVRLAK